jgi:Xaa-Pro aminopeptidase
MFVAALIIALLFTSLPAHAALAAPAQDGKNFNTNQMQQEWDNKLEKVDNNSDFYLRVRVYPADFEDPNELAIAHDLLNNYGVALRSAQRIVFNHPGFDLNGKVTNENIADQSLKELSEYLRQMRALKSKLDQLGGEYKLLPMSAVSTAPAQ